MYRYKQKKCFYCKDIIKSNQNIYMFKDNEFCNKKCRYQQMLEDDYKYII